jgi:hypothetical protein
MNPDPAPQLVVVGFYTNDPIYGEHASILEACLARYGITCDLTKIEKTDWHSATAYKPTLILQKIREYRAPVLYLDVDCFVHEDISAYFQRIEADLGVHFLEDTGALCSGTLYFNHTEKILQLLDAWIQGMRENPLVWDQKVLESIVEKKQIPGLGVFNLATEYLYIFDTTRKSHPSLRPVIEHLQASRETRHLAKAGTPRNRLLSLIGLGPKPSRKLATRFERMAEIRREMGRPKPRDR